MSSWAIQSRYYYVENVSFWRGIASYHSSRRASLHSRQNRGPEARQARTSTQHNHPSPFLRINCTSIDPPHQVIPHRQRAKRPHLASASFHRFPLSRVPTHPQVPMARTGSPSFPASLAMSPFAVVRLHAAARRALSLSCRLLHVWSPPAPGRGWTVDDCVP